LFATRAHSLCHHAVCVCFLGPAGALSRGELNSFQRSVHGVPLETATLNCALAAPAAFDALLLLRRRRRRRLLAPRRPAAR
jgi:hypothetical protein